MVKINYIDITTHNKKLYTKLIKLKKEHTITREYIVIGKYNAIREHILYT